MKRTCEFETTELIDVVDGRSGPEMERHVESCSSCGAEVARIRVILSAFLIPFADAPAEVLMQAKAIQLRTQPMVAKLVARTLGIVGVRRASASAFQHVFAAGDFRIRLLYEEEAGGWRVTGRVNPPMPSAVVTSGTLSRVVDIDLDGRFTFVARDLAESGVAITTDGQDIFVPPASED